MSKKSDLQKKKHIKHKADAAQKKQTAVIKQELIDNPPADFELFFGREDGEVVNGDIPIRWCISDAMRISLTESGVTDPHVLIISAKKGSNNEMSRQLVPFTQLMTYVRCTNSGDVTIHAWIINGLYGRKELTKKYLKRTNRNYDTDMLSYAGDPYTSNKEVAAYISTQIDVPAGVFGEEPGPKMKWFVNLWHTGKVVDECNFRQRKIVAVIFKWEFMVLYIAFMTMLRSVIAAMYTLSGYRRCVVWKNIRHVFYWDIEYVFDGASDYDDSYHNKFLDNDYVLSIKRDVGSRQPIFTTLALHPMCITILLTLTWVFGTDVYSIGEVIIKAGYLTIIVAEILFAVDVIVTLVFWAVTTSLWGHIETLVSYVAQLLLKRNNLGLKIIGTPISLVFVYLLGMIVYTYWQYFAIIFGGLAMMVIGFVIMYWLMIFVSNFITIDVKHNDLNKMQEVTCDECDMAIVPTIKTIPKKQRTVKLWYMETKNKVCKPMQR